VLQDLADNDFGNDHQRRAILELLQLSEKAAVEMEAVVLDKYRFFLVPAAAHWVLCKLIGDPSA
jgi:hypothetical protein